MRTGAGVAGRWTCGRGGGRWGVAVLSVALAVLAALGNAAASVLQRKAARSQPPTAASGLRMVWDLAHQPVWWAGIAAIVVGFLLQAGALATGPITLVQPVLVIELAFTMLLAAAVLGGRLHRREWLAIVGMSGGLALLLYALRPAGGERQGVALGLWVLAIVVTLAVVAALGVLGARAHHERRAVFLGVATGMGFGFTAALVAAVTSAYAAAGITGVFTAWQTWLLIALGPMFFVSLQKTMAAGRLVASQPALTLSNPIVAVGFGVAVFGEHLRGGAWLAGEVAAAALLIGCIVALARSPLLHDHEDHATPAATPTRNPGS